MENVNINVLQDQFKIMLCMLSHVSLHRFGQMQDDQQLNLCMMNGASHIQLNRDLNYCDNMKRVTTYLYFKIFLFNWCPLFVNCKKKFVYVCVLFVYLFQFVHCGNLSILMVLEYFMYNLETCHMHCLQDHIMLHSFQHTILLAYFLKQ